MKHLNDNELVLALDGEMDEAELKQAVDHMAECDECRERWEKLQGLSARVTAYQQSLYSGLQLAPKPLAADGRRLTQIENRGWSWGWGLAAAMALLALSVSMWMKSNSPAVVQKQKAPATAPTEPAQLASETHSSIGLQPAQSVTTANVKPVKSPKVHTPKKTPAADKPDTKLAQFTELPFSDASLPLDQATVVRVTLPAAALRQAGVAVNEDNANAMLKADVVLGMDGLPRGIRLVNQGSGGTN